MFASSIAFLFAISMWFYIFTLVFIIFAVICEENDTLIGAVIVFIGYCVLIQLWAEIDILKWVMKNPLHLLWILPSYAFIGLVWSWFKWWLKVTRLAKMIDEELLKFKTAEKITTDSLTTRQNNKFRQYSILHLEKPKFSENKRKISVWVMYWPTSVFWFFLNDFVKKAIRRLVESFHKVYEGMTNRAFKNIDNIKIVDNIKKVEKKGLNQ